MSAQIVTWDGSSSGNWSEAANWDSDPALPSSTDVATFDASAASGQYVITLGANRTVLGLDFTSSGSNGFTFNSGHALTVGTSGIVNLNSQTQTFDAEVRTSGTQTWTTTSGGLALSDVRLSSNLTLSGANAIDVTGVFTNYNANRNLTHNLTADLTLHDLYLSNNTSNRRLSILGSGNTVVTGVISGAGGAAGAGRLTKNGAGNLTLGASANTYTGQTTLQGSGTTYMGHDASFGTGELVLSGGTLDDGGAARTLANATRLSNSSTLTGSNGFEFTTPFTVSNGNRTLTVNNSGTNVLNDVALSNNATARKLTISGTGNLTISGVISDGVAVSNGRLGKSGTGTLTLGAANTYTGDTTLTGGGTVIAGHDDVFGTVGQVDLGTTTLQGDGSARDIGNITRLTGNLTLGGSSAFTLSGDMTLTGNRHLYIENTASTLITGNIALSNSTANRTFNLRGSQDLTISGNISNGASTAGRVSKFDAGTVTLDGNNSYGGTTDMNAGTLILNGTNTTTGIFQLDGGTVIAGNDAAFGTGELRLKTGTLEASGGARVLANHVLLNGSNADLTGSHDLTFTGDLTSNGNRTLTVTNTGHTTLGNILLSDSVTNRTFTLTNTGDVTIDGVVSNGLSSTSNFYKKGSGTVTLTGTNTYSGSTYLYEGVTEISDETNLGANPTSFNSSRLRFYGGTLKTTADLTIDDANRGININTGGGTIETSAGTTLTVANVISGSAGRTLTKTGTGTLTLTAANTVSGNIEVNAGTLVAASNTALGNVTGDTSVASGAVLSLTNNISIGNEALTLNGTGQLTNTSGTNSYAGVISGTGNLTTTSGSLTLSGANTYSGNTTVNSGSTLVLAADDALGSGGSTTVNSGGTLALQGGIKDDNQTLITIAGTGHAGAGAIQNISGANTLIAPITLSADATITADAGSLHLGDDTALDPFSEPISLGSSSLTFDTAGGDISVGATITGSGGIVKTGSGTLLLENGINSFTGTTAINDGTLVLNTYEYDISYPTEYGLEGDLIVGDGIGAANSAVFQQGSLEAPGTSNEYIKDTQSVTVNADGYWNLRGYKETITNLTLNGGTIDAKNSVGAGDRLDVTGVITAANATTSTINGRLGMNNDAAKSIVVDAGATLDINAILSNGGFVKTGSGTLELSGANTFTGVAQIDAGIVRVNNNNGLGATAGKTIVSGTGAQLRLENVTIGAESLDLAGTGISGDGALRSHSGANTWGGSIAMTGNAEIETASGSSLIVTGGITGSGTTLTVESIGTTTFNGVNTFGTLNKTGSGTLTVTNTNTYGTANISAGTFALGASNILSNTMDLNVTGTGNFNVGTHTETIDDLVGSGTLTVAGSGNLTIDKLGGTLSGGNPTGAFTGTLDVDGIMTLNGGTIGTGADGSGSTGSMILTAGNTLTIAGDFNFGGTLQLGTSGTGANLALSGAGTTFDLGALHVIGASSIDFSGVDATTLNLGNLTFDAGATLTVTGWESFSDLWTSTLFPGAVIDTRNATTAKITFSGFSNTDTIWLTYDYGANEITVPEPRSYGALLMAFALAAYATRRPRRHPEPT